MLEAYTWFTADDQLGTEFERTCCGRVADVVDILDDEAAPKPSGKRAQPLCCPGHAGVQDWPSTLAMKYAADVRAHRFPGPEHCFGIK